MSEEKIRHFRPPFPPTAVGQQVVTHPIDKNGRERRIYWIAMDTWVRARAPPREPRPPRAPHAPREPRPPRAPKSQARSEIGKALWAAKSEAEKAAIRQRLAAGKASMKGMTLEQKAELKAQRKVAANAARRTARQASRQAGRVPLAPAVATLALPRPTSRITVSNPRESTLDTLRRVAKRGIGAVTGPVNAQQRAMLQPPLVNTGPYQPQRIDINWDPAELTAPADVQRVRAPRAPAKKAAPKQWKNKEGR